MGPGRRLTVMPVEITTGYRRPDGQWPPHRSLGWSTSSTPVSLLTSMHQIRTIDVLALTSSWSHCAHYRPTEGELSRERLKSALSTAEGLLLQPRGEGELIELSDDEAVAAAVMLPMVAADRLAPSASSHTGGAFKRNARGIV